MVRFMLCVFEHNYRRILNSGCFVKKKKRWEVSSKTPVREKQLQSDTENMVLSMEESVSEASEP